MAENPSRQLNEIVGKIRQHLEKILIAVSGIAVLISGYYTYETKQQTDCQVQLLEAGQQVTNRFAEAMDVLLAQPPHPVEERRRVLGELQIALRRQENIQAEVGNCQ